MIIKALGKDGHDEYEAHVRKYGTVFNSLSWLSLFGDKVSVYGIYSNNQELIGGFCIYRKTKFGLSVYCMPPFTPEVGPFMKIDAKNTSHIADSWKEAVSLIADFIEGLPYSIVAIALNVHVRDTQPFIWKKFKVAPGYTYIIDLNQPPEQLWGNLSKKHRHDVNKAVRDGLVAKQICDMRIVRDLCIKTFARQGKEINTLDLDKILFGFSSPDNSYAFATFDGGVPIAASFYVYDRSASYAIIGGYDHEKKHHGAGTLADWEGILHARKLGLASFDFEGSMIPGIEKYFRGFGGQLTPYFRVNKAVLPLEVALKFVRRDLF
ncbi:MAG: GNAT family N-acetyltransferase [Nitrospiraceae bacterium]|nr:GNAT family N-acetyltransferase [Nitrospiraceae bacterium]